MDGDTSALAPPAAVLVAPAEWGVTQPIAADAFAELSGDELLAELEKHERWTAWLVARGVAITEALTRAREAESLSELEEKQPDAPARVRNLARAEVRACIEDEVALATGLPVSMTRARTQLAIGDPVRFGPVRSAVAAGQMSWQRAFHVLRATEEVPAEVMGDLVSDLVAPHPRRSVHGQGGLLVPQQVFTSRLRYRVAKVTTSTQRHENAVEKRSTMVFLDPKTGTGEFRVTGHAARVAGAHDRVEAIARRLRREGDTRPLAQLRSDIALDLILFGQLPTQAPLIDPHTGQAATATATAGEGAFAAYGTFDGELPPARVDVVVSLATLMGAGNEPGMIACGGEQDWLAARFVRDTAFAAGSTWRRLVTDPVTGHMVDLHVNGYAITGDLRERVFARDRVSRAPGSMRPARVCDTDHDLDHAAGGPSSESNVSAKHRRGHNHKTRRTWLTHREPGVTGDITWTTPTGRIYVTGPWDYRDPDPPTPEQMATNLEQERRRWDGETVDEPTVHVGDEDDWVLHDLHLDPDEPAPPRAPADPGVELVSQVEQWLAALIEDHGETPPVIVREPPPTPEPPGTPRTPWTRRDPGPPPF